MQFIVTFLAMAIVSGFFGAASCSAFRRVCYVTRWSAQRTGPARFTPEDIDPTLCTHVVFAYGNILGHQMEFLPSRATIDLYRGLELVKQANPALKVLVAVGGWKFRFSRLSVILSTSATRRQFIRSAMNYFRLYGFDGIDLHFVHPVTKRLTPEDRVMFTQLCQEFREAFEEDRRKTGSDYLLVVSGAADKKSIDRGYEVGKVSRLVDFVNLITYNFHGGWEHHTGHHSALFAGKADSLRESQLNVEWAVNYWVKKGVPQSKLVVGMALYGRGYTLSDPRQTRLGAPASGPSNLGRHMKQRGILAFNEVCQLLQGSVTRHWLRDQKVPYVTFGNQWIGYDDRASLIIKVKWLKTHHLGGWSAWSIDLDDVTGDECHLGRYPLLSAMSDALVEETEPEIVPTMSPTEIPAEETDFDYERFCLWRRDGRYPFPDNCSWYVDCEDHIGLVSMCPRNLVYDLDSQECILNDFAIGC